MALFHLKFFHDVLDEHFSQEDVQRQIDTALNWGRYAEVFGYNSETDRLILEPSTEITGSAEEPRPH